MNIKTRDKCTHSLRYSRITKLLTGSILITIFYEFFFLYQREIAQRHSVWNALQRYFLNRNRTCCAPLSTSYRSNHKYASPLRPTEIQTVRLFIDIRTFAHFPPNCSSTIVYPPRYLDRKPCPGSLFNRYPPRSDFVWLIEQPKRVQANRQGTIQYFELQRDHHRPNFSSFHPRSSHEPFFYINQIVLRENEEFFRFFVREVYQYIFIYVLYEAIYDFD